MKKSYLQQVTEDWDAAYTTSEAAAVGNLHLMEMVTRLEFAVSVLKTVESISGEFVTRRIAIEALSRLEREGKEQQ